MRASLNLLAALVMIIASAAFANALAEQRSYGEIVADAPEDAWRAVEPDHLLVLELETGRVLVELSPDLAPGHVAQMQGLAREHFYDGLTFYRVIDGFVAQGGEFGEPRETAMPRGLAPEFDEPFQEALPFAPFGHDDGFAPVAGFLNGFPAGHAPDEERIWLAHCTGALALGRENAQDTAGTEFYFTLQPQRYLDRNLSVFGLVRDGMSHLQKLNRVVPVDETTTEGEGAPGVILSMRLASDLPQDDRPTVFVFDTSSTLWPDLVASRANRPEAFFYHRPDYTRICAMPIPVRVE